jgi:putative Ca2+/H+ antiporter (TMEM165/GDT1 family)
VNLSVALVCFPVVFVGELPDKTMFASLLLATRGHPAQVWLGAASAFVVHVAIAVTVGVALFDLLPHRAVEALVAAVFLLSAVYAWREGTKDERPLAEHEAARHSAVITAFVVIFVAEWGDLTQLLTANLATRYHSAISVGLGSVLALWAVAGLAVIGGQAVLRLVDVSTLRKVTAVALVGIGGYTLYVAIR